jgi:hypothetical protein
MMYEGPERRQHHELSEDLIDHIAEKAAEKALNKVYQEVGKSVLKKLAWAAGLVVTALAIWAMGGQIK